MQRYRDWFLKSRVRFGVPVGAVLLISVLGGGIFLNQTQTGHTEEQTETITPNAPTDTVGTQPCASCHSVNPAASKRDFPLGDLVGALAVDRPFMYEPEIGLPHGLSALVESTAMRGLWSKQLKWGIQNG
jgi:hypothetical protein